MTILMPLLNFVTVSMLLQANSNLFFQMALKDKPNLIRMVFKWQFFFRKSIEIARQLGAPPPDPVCDGHELNPYAHSTAPNCDNFKNKLTFGFKLPKSPEQNPICTPAVNTRNCYIHYSFFSRN